MLKYSDRVESWRRMLAVSTINRWCSLLCQSATGFAKLKRLLNKIERAGLGGLDSLGDRAIARDYDYLGCGTRVLDVAHNFKAIHIRQYQIANDNLMPGLVEGFIAAAPLVAISTE